jgi:hypothetical protein
MPRERLYLHLLVLGLALTSVLLNRLIPPLSLRPTGAENESPLLQVLLLLGATVGLPYFALSSTGPLLQKWYSESLDKSPYRLFALSNFGSLLALLSYPFFFEANWGIASQAAMWSLGFVVFALCCGAVIANRLSKNLPICHRLWPLRPLPRVSCRCLVG